jgi:short-subunit dehydrogenase
VSNETMPTRTALVTGASSGIGAALATVFAAEGFDLVVTARREERLRSLANRLSRASGRRVEVIVADLSKQDAPTVLCAELARREIAIDVLVNCAGFGVPGAFLSSPWERHAELLQVTVNAASELTYRLLPGMVERGYGRVLNMASLAALVPAPAGHTLYAACKALIVKFSEALAGEVRGSGVFVTVLCPGFTLSEFHDVTGTRALVQRLPRWLWSDAESVAREGFDALMRGAPLHVPGRVNRLILTLSRLLPERTLRGIGRLTAGRYRNST